MNVFTMLLKIRDDLATQNYKQAWADFVAVVAFLSGGAAPHGAHKMTASKSWVPPLVNTPQGAMFAIEEFCHDHGVAAASDAAPAVDKINWSGLIALLAKIGAFLIPLLVG